MNKNKKKLFSLIDKEIPDKDLFERIQNNFEEEKIGRRKRNKIRLASSLVSFCAFLGVETFTFSFALQDKNLNASIKGEVEVSEGVSGGVSGGDYPAYSGGHWTEGAVDDELEVPGDSGETAEGGTTEENQAKKAKLTATEYSDLENYSVWKKLLNDDLYDENQNVIPGFKNYFSGVYQSLSNTPKTSNLVKVHLENEQKENLPFKKVELYQNNTLVYTSISDTKGNCYMYTKDNYDKLKLKIDDEYMNITMEDEENYLFNITLNEVKKEAVNLDLAFLIDTTGSMWDELAYLQDNVKYIIDNVYKTNPNYQINLALSFYRDKGDEYVTRTFDFTSDYQTACNNLSLQKASGGGDYEEAVHQGLNEINNLSWKDDSVKLVFHIFDAPCHSNKYIDVYDEYFEFANKGIRYIPLAASGLNKLGEFIAREGALFTGGTYTSLTNHSGIGGNHIEISKDQETTVEYLSDLIERLIKEYMTGKDIDPMSYNSNSNQ